MKNAQRIKDAEFFFKKKKFILEDKDSELNPHSFYKNDSIKEVDQQHKTNGPTQTNVMQVLEFILFCFIAQLAQLMSTQEYVSDSHKCNVKNIPTSVHISPHQSMYFCKLNNYYSRNRFLYNDASNHAVELCCFHRWREREREREIMTFGNLDLCFLFLSSGLETHCFQI